MSGTTHSKTLRTFRDWRTGEGLRQRGMNRTHDVIRDLQGGVDQPMQVVSVARGVPIEAGAAMARTFRLKRVLNEYLECNAYATDGTFDTDELVYIAKPHVLRKSTFHQQVVNGIAYDYIGPTLRWAHIGGHPTAEDEKQMVIPIWNTGDPITAVRVQWSGVHRADVLLPWQDVNDGARAFAFFEFRQ